VKTGGVLVMVSTPSYDPNLFVTGISYKDYDALNGSLDLPLFNRAIQGQYPPGSTVKPMLGVGGLHAGVVNTQSSVLDPGYFQLKGEERKYRDWKRKGHAHRVQLHQAIVQSCDTYFYELAYKTGIDRMHEFGSHFGLGVRTGVDIPSERTGIWPSREWKRRARGLAWYPGDTINVGIGQGAVLTTPLQLATMSATLASRGELIKPKFVRNVGPEEDAREEDNEDLNETQGLKVSERHWDSVYKAMEDVVHSPRGTAQSINRGLTYRMAGKTGTAQVVGIAQGEEYDSEALKERQRDHALFVAFAPVDDPKIAIAVIVENGEKSSSAAKVARKVVDVYMLDQSDEDAPL
jgi:penicillin-binding protein 2